MLEKIKSDKLKKVINYIVNKWNKIWNNHLECFYFLSLIFTIIFAVLVLYPKAQNTFLNCNTDDVLQYYPYINGFFEKIKHGTLSLYDTNLLGGTSFFSGVYYLPLDSFLGLAFILSFFMSTEVAYCISNIIRVIAGALLIYYVFQRKGFKPTICFIISLIFFAGGMTETLYIFPVFLGISFYAPLAMLLVDLCLEKKKLSYYLLIPLYAVTIVLYDFYIAYMLFAFLCVYYVIESHLHYDKFFLINKEFWINFLEFMMMVVIGVCMSAFFLVPSAFYVLNESGRANQTSNDFLWLYGKIADGKPEISFRHYFAQWVNLFSPNNPHNLGLWQAGDYIREHASLYMTSGGILYLAYFFFIWGKKENRLKLWVILFNLLFCIPLFAMIFTFNEWPYVRWFFIPYMINFYAMAIAMNKNDFKIGNINIIKIFPFVFMILGLATMIYMLIKADPSLFFHYFKQENGNDIYNEYYNPIAIGSIVCISIYLILLIAAFILQSLKKDHKFIYKLVPITIFAECIFALVICFSSVGTTDYSSKLKEMEAQKNELYNLGYDEADGYRINLYTSKAKSTYNANILLGNVNHARFFQSFNNHYLSVYYGDIHSEAITGWSKTSMHGYTIMSGPQFNLKYVLTEEKSGGYITALPSELYNKLGVYHDTAYYELKESPQFIVYDTFYESSTIGSASADMFIKDYSLLYYGYIKNPNITQDISEIKDKTTIYQYNMYQKLTNSNLDIIPAKDAYDDVRTSGYINKVTLTKDNTTLNYNRTDYIIADLTKGQYSSILTRDAIYVCPTTSAISADSNMNMYVRNPKTRGLYNLHYNVGYLTAWDKDYDFLPSELWVKTSNSSTIYLYGFDYDIYYDFLEIQSRYTNRYYELNKDEMTIRFKNANLNKTKIVKTAYSYSEDWKVKDNKYKTCDINGGFLGIIIPAGEEFVDITLNYEPDGFIFGCKISGVGLIIYLSISIPLLILFIKKRRNNSFIVVDDNIINEKNDDNSSNEELI